MNALAVIGYQEILIVVLIIFLLFGASRLPQLARALGQSKRAFREGLDEAEEEARLEESRRRERLRAAESRRVEDDELASDRSAPERRP